MPKVALLAIAACLLGARDAYAYIDPNMGGWLFQLLFPLLMALAGAWAVLRHRIRQMFSVLLEKLRGKGQ